MKAYLKAKWGPTQCQQGNNKLVGESTECDIVCKSGKRINNYQIICKEVHVEVNHYFLLPLLLNSCLSFYKPLCEIGLEKQN